MGLMAFHVKLSFLEVSFRMLTLFVVVHVTSNAKKLLNTKFWNIVGKGSILKMENLYFSCYNLTTPMKFFTQNWYT